MIWAPLGMVWATFGQLFCPVSGIASLWPRLLDAGSQRHSSLIVVEPERERLRIPVNSAT